MKNSEYKQKGINTYSGIANKTPLAVCAMGDIMPDERILPYNLNTRLIDKIFSALKTIPSGGMDRQMFITQIGEAKNPLIAYSLYLFKYIGVIDIDGGKLSLTQKGQAVCYATKEKRDQILIKNLPDRYLAITNWIRFSDEKQLSPAEVKQKFGETYGNIIKESTLENGIASYVNYGKYIGLVLAVGSAQSARIKLTDNGISILDSNPMQPEPAKPAPEAQPSHSQSQHPAQTNKGSTTGYAISIITDDRRFDWDIRSMADFDAIEAIIASVKKDLIRRKVVEEKDDHVPEKGEHK